MTASGYWRDGRIADRLRVLWAEGLSCSHIARILNHEFALAGGLTRNAIIGKVTRLGLPMRHAQPAQVRRPAYAPKRPDNVATPKAIPDPPPSERIGIMALTNETCRFPFGDSNFTFCGRAPKPDSVYCDSHHARCFTPVTKRSPRPYVAKMERAA